VTDGEQRRGFLPRRTLRRLARSMVSTIEMRLERLAAAWRHEAHRVIALLALSMAAASFVVAAVFFAVLGIILALWETQRVLAFALASGVFAVFGLVALLLIRRNLRTVHRRRLPAPDSDSDY
jgi:uncharacterized membrane protein YqjE